MSNSTAKPFRRITSLMKLKNRTETPYQPWEEDDEVTDESACGKPILAPAVELDGLVSPTSSQENGVLSRKDTDDELLVECFYLGSSNMTGLEIRGRGCINTSAAAIWEHTQQENRKPKRANSWSSKLHHESNPTSTSTASSKLRYVRLAVGPEALVIQDNSNDQQINQFSYRKISFVGTHPKYTRLFAFIAESPDSPTPFCHAFKCEDKASASQAACKLSDVFQKKIQQLLLQTKKIEVTASTTVVP